MKDWPRIEEVFGSALELPPEARRRFLDQACGGDAALRSEVEALLESDRLADDFLDRPLRIPEAAALEPGERLGTYRVVRPIGEGGMGTVFLARRADGSFAQEVAIKVLRRGTESRSAVERLERERQILATLDHPGIARLLDGGSTPAGLPYVVMELIAGEPIDSFCDRRRLRAGARVDLIVEVCAAVSAAHRALVVHRDIKPSNILIDATGRPRLLDFGIAKLIEPEPLGSPREPTACWDRRLTPSYASPEQIRGDPITVAADVYQLGVVLYKLLTGELPHRLEGRSPAEIERILASRAPRRPSDAARQAAAGDPTRLAARIDADLDHIVMKALRGDPAARYRSVDELADDLRRFRGGLPVAARHGSVSYRAGKFLRRHWAPLATALVFVLVLALFAVSSTVQALRLERTLGRLVAVEGFLVDLFRASSPEAARGREPKVAEVLERGEARLAAGTVGESGTRGLLHALFGRIALSLGDLGRARDHLEKALDAYREIEGDTVLELARARAESDLAIVHLHQEEAARAEALAREALARGRRVTGAGSEDLLELITNLATVYCWQGEWDLAAPLSDEAFAVVESLGPSPSVPAAAALALRALLMKNRAHDPEGARALYAEALETYRRLEGAIHPEVAVILNQLGVLAQESGDSETATRRLAEALEVRRSLYREGHWEIAQSLYNLAMAHRGAGELATADELLEEAVEIYARDPDRGPAFNRTVFYLLRLAEVRLARGDACGAEALVQRRIPAAWWTARPPDHWLAAWAEGVLGCALAAQGRRAEAEAAIGPSLEVLRRSRGDDASQTRFVAECAAELAPVPP